MGDGHLRELERLAMTGDRDAMGRLLAGERRAGRPSPRSADCAEGRHRLVRVDIGDLQHSLGTTVQGLACVDCWNAIVLPDVRVPEAAPEIVTHYGHWVWRTESRPVIRGKHLVRFDHQLTYACGHASPLSLPRSALARCDGRLACGSCPRTTRRAECIQRAPTIFEWLKRIASTFEDRPPPGQAFLGGFEHVGAPCELCQGSGLYEVGLRCSRCRGSGRVHGAPLEEVSR